LELNGLPSRIRELGTHDTELPMVSHRRAVALPAAARVRRAAARASDARNTTRRTPTRRTAACRTPTDGWSTARAHGAAARERSPAARGPTSTVARPTRAASEQAETRAHQRQERCCTQAREAPSPRRRGNRTKLVRMRFHSYSSSGLHLERQLDHPAKGEKEFSLSRSRVA